MNNLNQWIPRLILAVTALCFGYGLIIESFLSDVAADGFVNAADKDDERRSWMWLMFVRVWLAAMGLQVQRSAELSR